MRALICSVLASLLIAAPAAAGPKLSLDFDPAFSRAAVPPAGRIALGGMRYGSAMYLPGTVLAGFSGGGVITSSGGTLGTSPVISFTTSLVFKDNAGNTMATLTDDGTVGSAAITGDLTFSTAGRGLIGSGIRQLSLGDTTQATALSSRVLDGATAVGVRLDTYSDYSTAGARIVSAGDNSGVSYSEKWAIMHDGGQLLAPTATTIADSGGAGAAAYTTHPNGAISEVTCADADGCDWTITETGATNGEMHRIVNVGTNTLTMKFAAGQVLLNGGADVALGQNDNVLVYYSTARSAWVQLGTTGNN